jgi:hypothetical protein
MVVGFTNYRLDWHCGTETWRETAKVYRPWLLKDGGWTVFNFTGLSQLKRRGYAKSSSP